MNALGYVLPVVLGGPALVGWITRDKNVPNSRPSVAESGETAPSSPALGEVNNP